MADRRTHWLRRNAAARIPRRVICLDSEAWRERGTYVETQTFRLASITFDLLDANGRQETETTRLDFGDDYALWAWVDSFTSAKHRTVCFMHSASYDVRLTNALVHLPALGWRYKNGALNSYGYWSTWRNGERSLWLCDSLSFLPASIERLSQLAKLEKTPLPDDDADEDEWVKHCRADVEVLRECVLRTIRYLKRNDLGDFRNTGAGQASAAFRHRFLKTGTLLVHDDAEALAAERQAAWAGRAEVWRHGETNETLYEYDYEYAYARIAQSALLPSRYQGAHGPIPEHRMRKVLEHYAVLADCKIRTDVPVVPTNVAGNICWPVGEFSTVLWDNELSQLRREGGSVEIGRYFYYRRTPLLTPWADWILAELAKPSNRLDPVIRVMLKDWSRSLIGRFGLRYQSLEQIGELPTAALSLRGVSYDDERPNGYHLQIGTQLFDRKEQVESPNSTPAIMSYIMAQARINLWEAVQNAGETNVYYVDTDGLITNKTGARLLDKSISTGVLPGLRRKAIHSGGDFRSPRNVDLGESRRVNGAPSKSERLAPGVYRGQTWESIRLALEHNRPGQVRLHEREFHVSEFDPRRVHLPDGSTAPLRLRIENGENVIAESLDAAALVA